MRKALLASALAIAALPAAADDLLSKGADLLGTQGAAAPSATAGLSSMPTDQLIEMVEKQGYSNVSGLGLDGDVLKASALNKVGAPVDLLIDPTTGNVLQALLK